MATKPQPPYESAHYGGSNAQYGRYGERGGGSNAQHGQSRGQNAQYADPSQPYPDLALQYSPGTAGRSRRPARRGRRGRTIALISAAVVVAAGVGAGVALALNGNSSGSPPPPAASNSASANLPGSVQALDDPSNSIPAGWTQETVQPSATGTTAGFSIATPPGWTEKRSGRSTYFYAPNGAWFMKVDLTPHTSPDMVTEAQYIEKQSAATFPQYKRASLRAVPIRGTNGAFWQFTWVPSGSITTRSDDILFIKKTPAGSQSYAIYFRAPTPGNDWNTKYLPVFKKMLRTFQTVPS